MSFPGRHAGTKYSFPDPTQHCSEHEVTNPPVTGKHHNCTIAQYSNIEHGEKNIKEARHLRHGK